MNRRAFLTSALSLVAMPALAAVAAEETFDQLWTNRIDTTPVYDGTKWLTLRHVQPAEPFDEQQFEEEIRKRELKQPPKPEPPKRRRRRRAYRRWRRGRHAAQTQGGG